jgi:hypothetical protein
MIKVNDRVRCTDETLNAKYGILEVWEIKGGFAVCKFGDFSTMSIVTVRLSDLKHT